MLDYGILSGLPFKVLSTYSTTCDMLVFTWQANECSFTMPGGLVLGAPLESCPRARTRLPRGTNLALRAHVQALHRFCPLRHIGPAGGSHFIPPALCPGSKVEAGSGSGSARNALAFVCRKQLAPPPMISPPSKRRRLRSTGHSKLCAY